MTTKQMTEAEAIEWVYEEDRETEAECEPLSAEDLRDKNAWAKAEHANEKAEGA